MDETKSTPSVASDGSPTGVELEGTASVHDNRGPPIAPWLRVAAVDLENRDFEAPIAGSKSAMSYELSEQYRSAAQLFEDGTETADRSETRLFTMLAAITGMHLKAHERDEPFGPMLAFADGRRSAIPADFRDGHIDILADMAIRAANPLLRARLADLSWLLDRKRGRLGAVAVAAYVDTVEGVECGKLKFPYAHDTGALEHGASEMLRRSLVIGRSIGWDKPETIRARSTVGRLRERTVQRRAAVALLWFAELDLDNGVSDPVRVAKGIEEVLSVEANADVHIVTSLWRLAARGYHAAKRDAEKVRCQIAAAEAMATEAERILTGINQMQGSAMLAAHMMSNAIAQLSGAPAAKERRTALRHRLVDIQARIPEEMSVFSHQWDIADLEARIQKALDVDSLVDQLFMFVSISHSPDPAKLVTRAEESMRQHPLSSLFSAVHLDKEGKAVHRSAATGLSDEPADSAVRRQIAQAESIRRNLAGATIDIARQAIMTRQFLAEDVLASLLQHSPLVPSDLVATFTRGFLRFFQGDFTSAIYILAPLLEGALRHVLKLNGHDVTIFQDATQTQQDRTISSLFEQMRNELDAAFTKPITADIENVFLRLPGPHLRHDIAHGLAHDGTPYGPDVVYGCWLIFRLCLLPLFAYRDQLRNLIH